jgi:hypothetical protein
MPKDSEGAEPKGPSDPEATETEPREPDEDEEDEAADDEDDEEADEDEEDEAADDEDDEDDEPRPKRDAARPSRRSKTPPTALTEEQINSPKRQTLYLLAVVAGATVIMWGAARFACNAHPPDSRRARPATTDQLARTPKGAAVELQQRWTSHRLVEALDLAKGEVATQLQKEVKDCEENLAACDAKREQLEGKVSSMGEQLDRDARSAKVRVKTTVGNETQTFVLELEADGPLWKVTKRTPDKG